MRTIMALGVVAIIGLAGCATDPYGYGYGYGYGAPDPSARANYGEIYLSAGFDDDPYVVSIQSGGSIDAASLGSGCTGTISSAPDFQLTYDAGSFPLTFGAGGDDDVTLVINGPDGRWYCDDDSGDGTDAEIRFGRPQSGVYDIWVGAYGGRSSRSALLITELD